MNKVFLIGNLTKDPELTQTANGKSVCRFTLAVQRKFANTQGVREADFLTITVWGANADNCNKYLRKGSKAAVSGSIRTGSFEQDGIRRYTTEINADEVQFLSTKNELDDTNYEELPSSQPSAFNNMKAVEDDEELPF